MRQKADKMSRRQKEAYATSQIKKMEKDSKDNKVREAYKYLYVKRKKAKLAIDKM